MPDRAKPRQCRSTDGAFVGDAEVRREGRPGRERRRPRRRCRCVVSVPRVRVDREGLQAVLRGVKHGFSPDHNRIEHWRGGP
jgi:hypothetical protein